MVRRSETQSLVRRNWAAFKKHRPGVFAVLEKISTPVSTLVVEDGVAVNINLGEINLYPEHAVKWTKDQLDQHFRNPDRIIFSDPWHCNITTVSKKLLKKLAAYLIEKGMSEGEGYPVADVGFGFIFGIGLGYHIPELLAGKVCRHMVLIEPIPEFIIHSFAAVDWGKIFRAASRKNINLYFLPHESPDENIHAIQRIISSCGTTFLDGSQAYIHYPSWNIQETRKILNEKIKNFYISSGYFEDELIMMKNTYLNFIKWPFSLVSRKPYLEQTIPVFIVGSGPSVDKDMPYIKKWRDRVIVFSCGTSLGILLKNEIRPDLHLENENTPQLLDNLKNFKNEYGLEGITLVVTTTVHPDVSGLFDNRWYFFRPALSSSVLLLGSAEPLRGSDPLVSNAALAVSSAVGFKNIYLFGVDCGRRDGTAHHSQDAVYYEEDYDNYAAGESFDFIEKQLNREVPANFGGKAMTSWSLDLSRINLSILQRTGNFTLFNCSDGARIDGATPKAAAAINLTNPPAQQLLTLKRIENQLTHYKADEYLDAVDLAADAKGCDKFIEKFRELVETAKHKDKSFWEIEQRLDRLWNENFVELKGALKMTGGSYAAMLRLGAFLGNRIVNTRKRRKFMRFFLDEYGKSCVWMAGEARIRLKEMSERKTDLTDVGDADAVDAQQPGVSGKNVDE
ncbi:MAG: hypothetical protein A3G18_03075 [Rhodospirillales bacterium RIFCSPLOWO2_12_FULL_58_28]|nr:MAG: hypothetical protein A3H92_06480 [Rhodospirillales bacterium RIFCSPLOWO2_02_FULL_58_16]OHC77209.1 MAG: hypothetical protein A3G18_03075 [Rhodospirillales bacterium RIFCSPLOWO2_12_FULL_58_28]